MAWVWDGGAGDWGRGPTKQRPDHGRMERSGRAQVQRRAAARGSSRGQREIRSRMEASHRSKMDGHGPWSSKEGGCRAQILLRGGGYQGKATVTANAPEACRSLSPPAPPPPRHGRPPE